MDSEDSCTDAAVTQAIEQLAHVVHSHSDVSLQALAAVLLRGIILRETEVWRAIDAQTQTQGKQATSSCVSFAEKRLGHAEDADENAVAFCPCAGGVMSIQ